MNVGWFSICLGGRLCATWTIPIGFLGNSPQFQMVAKLLGTCQPLGAKTPTFPNFRPQRAWSVVLMTRIFRKERIVLDQGMSCFVLPFHVQPQTWGLDPNSFAVDMCRDARTDICSIFHSNSHNSHTKKHPKNQPASHFRMAQVWIFRQKFLAPPAILPPPGCGLETLRSDFGPDPAGFLREFGRQNLEHSAILPTSMHIHTIYDMIYVYSMVSRMYPENKHKKMEQPWFIKENDLQTVGKKMSIYCRVSGNSWLLVESPLQKHNQLGSWNHDRKLDS